VSLRIKELTIRRGDFVLRVPDLSFPAASLTSIVGPNGAGKTTLLKCISALLPVRKGSLFYGGKDISLLHAEERARIVAYVPQEHSLAFNYSVRDFVLMGRAAYHALFSVPSDRDVTIAEEALEFVGLPGFARRPYFELSSGERRLVLIARALAQKSEILILDEPTSFLDPRHEIEIMELSRKLALEWKKTLLVTLHDLDLAVKYSDHLVFMKGGGIFASGKPPDILDEVLLETVYDIPMKIVDYDGRKLIVR
jgi:iron complex transport system ATP-binding protein